MKKHLEKQTKKLKEKETGITLIALVITVIVLLILAGISITMLAGDNSILQKAGEAKELTGKAQTLEAIEVAVLGSYNDRAELEVETVKTNVRNEVENLESIDGDDFPLTITTKDGIKYVVDGNGNITEPVDRTGIEVGSYIDYTPDVPSTTVYEKSKLASTITGSDSNSAIKQDTLDWQVLRIYDDGSMDLIGSPTSQDIYFYGILGYSNGVYIMDEICKTLYSRSGIEARSVDLEDFEYWLEKSEGGVEARANYGKNQPYEYNKENTYSSNNKYPPLYKTQKNESDPATLTTDSNYATNGDLVTKSTDYYISINNANYGAGATALANNRWYWLASRWVYCRSDYARFGLRHADTNIDGSFMFRSYGDSHDACHRLRPVVHLKSSVKITAKAGTIDEKHKITSY